MGRVVPFPNQFRLGFLRARFTLMPRTGMCIPRTCSPIISDAIFPPVPHVTYKTVGFTSISLNCDSSSNMQRRVAETRDIGRAADRYDVRFPSPWLRSSSAFSSMNGTRCQ